MNTVSETASVTLTLRLQFTPGPSVKPDRVTDVELTTTEPEGQLFCAVVVPTICMLFPEGRTSVKVIPVSVNEPLLL